MPKYIITIGRDERHIMEAGSLEEVQAKVLDWNGISVTEKKGK